MTLLRVFSLVPLALLALYPFAQSSDFTSEQAGRAIRCPTLSGPKSYDICSSQIREKTPDSTDFAPWAINNYLSSSSILVPVSTTNWQGPMDMCVLNGYLYVVANLGMLVWDVRDPTNPSYVTQYDWPTTVRSTFVLKGVGEFLYLLSSNEGVSIIDASDPNNLIVRSKLPLPVQQDYMEVGGHFLYIASIYDYFFVIDVADPDHPRIVTQYTTTELDFGWLHGMTMRQTDTMPLVYFSSAWGNSPLFTYTLDDSVTPRHVRTYYGPADGKPAFFGRLVAHGDQLVGYSYAASSYVVMNVAEPYFPEFGCGVELGTPITHLTMSGQVMYVMTTAGVRTYDISTLCSPSLIGTALLQGFTDGSTGRGVAVGQWLYNYGYDSKEHVRIAQSDMSDPSQPVTRSLYSAKISQKLFVAPTEPQMVASTSRELESCRAFDLTDPPFPLQAADFGPGSNAEHTNGATYSGAQMYLASSDSSRPKRRGSLSRFEIHDPNHPLLLSQIVFGTNSDNSRMSFEDVAVANDYAYVAAEDSGLYVFQYLTQQYNPTLRSVLSLPPQAHAIRIRGNRAYIVCWGRNLYLDVYEGAFLVVVDISNPLQPIVVGNQEPWGHYNIEMHGEIIATTSWIVDHWAVTLYRIDSTGWPEPVGIYDPPDRSADLILLELTTQHLYVDNGDFLDIVDITNPAMPILAERQFRVGKVYDVAVKGEVVYIGQEYGIQTYRGPSCCEGTTGNVDGHGGVDLSDLSRLISFMTSNGSLVCQSEADIDQSGGTDLSDLSLLIAYLVSGSASLPSCVS